MCAIRESRGNIDRVEANIIIYQRIAIDFQDVVLIIELCKAADFAHANGSLHGEWLLSQGGVSVNLLKRDQVCQGVTNCDYLIGQVELELRFFVVA